MEKYLKKTNTATFEVITSKNQVIYAKIWGDSFSHNLPKIGENFTNWRKNNRGFRKVPIADGDLDFLLDS